MQRISNMFRGLIMPAAANQSAGKRSLKGIGIVGIGLIGLFLIVVGCAEDGGGIRYTCTNGTAAAGTASADGIQNCASCNSGYTLSNVRCVSSGPANVRASNTSRTSVTLNWTNPATINYTSIRITWSPADNGGSANLSDTSRTTYTVSGLSAQKAYTFSVHGRTGNTTTPTTSATYTIYCDRNPFRVGETATCVVPANTTVPLALDSTHDNRVYLLSQSGGALSNMSDSAGRLGPACPSGGASIDHDATTDTAAINVCPNGNKVLAVQTKGLYTLSLHSSSALSSFAVTAANAPSQVKLFPLNVAVDPTHDYWYYFYSPANSHVGMTITASTRRPANAVNGSISLVSAMFYFSNPGTFIYQLTLGSNDGNLGNASNPTLPITRSRDNDNRSAPTMGVRLVRIRDHGLGGTSKRYTFRLHN